MIFTDVDDCAYDNVLHKSAMSVSAVDDDLSDSYMAINNRHPYYEARSTDCNQSFRVQSVQTKSENEMTTLIRPVPSSRIFCCSSNKPPTIPVNAANNSKQQVLYCDAQTKIPTTRKRTCYTLSEGAVLQTGRRLNCNALETADRVQLSNDTSLLFAHKLARRNQNRLVVTISNTF